MNEINITELILIGLFTACTVISAIVCLIISTVRIIKKKLKVKNILIMISIVMCFGIAAGTVAYGEYRKDIWFTDWKRDMTDKYDKITDMNMETGMSGMFISVIFDNSTDIEYVDEVYNEIKEYLFNNPSGENPSQQSYTKRGEGEYTQIYLSFKNESGDDLGFNTAAYTNGAGTVIDNFKTWYPVFP